MEQLKIGHRHVAGSLSDLATTLANPTLSSGVAGSAFSCSVMEVDPNPGRLLPQTINNWRTGATGERSVIRVQRQISMMILISPAKTLDFETEFPCAEFTQPDRLERAESLIRTLRRQSMKGLMELMKISPDLARLNRDRYREWSLPMTPENARPAIFAFQGDVYQGLDARTLRPTDLKFAQKSLRILSGLHGMLRPLDLIQPYRLEMGTRLKTRRGATLYDFWKTEVTEALNADLDATSQSQIVNLASNEYFQVLQPHNLHAEIVTPTFKEWKNGQFRFLSFFAKRARGLMVRYAIEHRIREADQLKSFDVDGYRFNPELSEQNDWVFTRTAVSDQ